MERKKYLHGLSLKVMNTAHARALALFQDCENECHGITSTDARNAIYNKKYAHFVAFETSFVEYAGRVYFYTSPDMPTATKRITHRATVAAMRADGVHRRQLSDLMPWPPVGQF